MKSCELTLSEDSLLKLLEEDILGRKTAVANMAELLNCIDGNMIISLDGAWGSGKTFFVKQVIACIDALSENHHSEYSENFLSRITETLKRPKGISFSRMLPIYFDAWANDNDDDPLFSLLYYITNEYKIRISNNLNKKEIINDLIKLIEGISSKTALDNPVTSSLISKGLFNVIKQVLFPKNILADIQEKKAIENKVKNFFDELTTKVSDNKTRCCLFQGKKTQDPYSDHNYKRIVIFIDELDRCKPTYAVKLLERIKHYMKHENIIFVFSTNLEQLQHTIKANYGSDFDACSYLDRFFGLSMALPELDIETYCNLMEKSISSNIETEIFCGISRLLIREFDLTIREIEHFYMVCEIAIRKVFCLNCTLSEQNRKTQKACLSIFLPIMIILRMKNITKYTNFINGNEAEFISLMSSDLFKVPFVAEVLKEAREDAVPQINIPKRVTRFYHAVFSKFEKREKRIGNMNITPCNKAELLDLVSLLSPNSSYHHTQAQHPFS